MNENELMLTSVLDCRRVDLAVKKEALTAAQKLRYDQMRARRTEGEPLQYIIGQCDFMGIPLSVDRRVLIPRPETEILVDLAVEEIKSMPESELFKALDIGVGSGNITVALLKNIPNLKMVALDASNEALTLAAENAKANNVEQRVDFLCTDMALYLKDAADAGKMFNAIISNPPYIPTEKMAHLPSDVKHEPCLALDGGIDGLKYYRMIIEYGWKLLDANGFLVMEIGDGQRADIEAIFAQYPQYREINFYKDYVGTDRIVFARSGELWKS
jgi:release factor glutamine methyltransferase